MADMEQHTPRWVMWWLGVWSVLIVGAGIVNLIETDGVVGRPRLWYGGIGIVCTAILWWKRRRTPLE